MRWGPGSAEASPGDQRLSTSFPSPLLRKGRRGGGGEEAQDHPATWNEAPPLREGGAAGDLAPPPSAKAKAGHQSPQVGGRGRLGSPAQGGAAGQVAPQRLVSWGPRGP